MIWLKKFKIEDGHFEILKWIIARKVMCWVQNDHFPFWNLKWIVALNYQFQMSHHPYLEISKLGSNFPLSYFLYFDFNDFDFQISNLCIGSLFSSFRPSWVPSKLTPSPHPMGHTTLTTLLSVIVVKIFGSPS